VFLKGCSLRCPWCSNPENITPSVQSYRKDGAEGTYGRWYSVDELVRECVKDKGYYDGRIGREGWKITKAEDIENLAGGVTFSGGEALLQMDRLVPVCERLHEDGIHIAAETALFVPEHQLEFAIKHIDFFYVDMKILDTVRCREVEKGNLELYLSNLETLMCSEAPVVIRVPVIGGYTDLPGNRAAVRELLTRYRNRVLKVELIKEHNLGEGKYKSMGMQMHYIGVDDVLMEKYKTELEELNIPVEICMI